MDGIPSSYFDVEYALFLYQAFCYKVKRFLPSDSEVEYREWKPEMY